MAYGNQNSFNRKPYSKLTAQIAKNTIKKHLYSIRTGGARAADDLIDQFIGKGDQNHRNSHIQREMSAFEREYRPMIEKNRGKWRNFIIELSGRFDPEALATVGVGIVYGGIMTSSVGNVGWAAEIDLGDKFTEIPAEKIKKVSETISAGRNRGCMIWIMKGKGTYSSEMLRLYRYNPDCVFFLADSEEDRVRSMKGTEKNELLGAKNIVLVLSGKDRNTISYVDTTGIPYVLDPSMNDGKSHSVATPMRGYDRELIGFFDSPTFPLSINGISEAADVVEKLLSEGKSRQIPRYKI